MSTNKTPHKWAKEIKAWADGAIIEYRVFHLSQPSNFSNLLSITIVAGK
jgi:hypothetical protein